MPRSDGAGLHFAGALVSKLTPPLVQLALLVIVAREGTLSDVGVVALGSSAAFLCGSLGEAGFGTSLSVPEAYFRRPLPPLRGTRVARTRAGLAGTALYLCLWAAGLGGHHPSLLVLAPLPYLLALSYGIAGALNHASAMRLEAVITGFESVVVVAVAGTAFIGISPVYAVFLGLTVGRCLGMGARTWVTRQMPTDARDVEAVGAIQRRFLATTAATVAQGQADVLVIGFIGSLAAVGVYAPLLRIAYGALLVAEALAWALYPARREEAGERAGIGALLVRRWRLTGIGLGLAGGAGFFLVAGPFLDFVVHRHIAGLGTPIAIFAGVIAIRFCAFTASVDIVRAGLQMKRLPYLIAAAVVLLFAAVLSRGTSVTTLAGGRLVSEALLAVGYALIVLRPKRRPEGVVLPWSLPMAEERLHGARCPGCHALLERTACSCSSELRPLRFHQAYSVGNPAPTFAQPIDERIVDEIVPALAAAKPPLSVEHELERFAAGNGYELGNPVWEGRMDVARLLPNAGGVVLDLGSGLGTNTAAIARGAKHVFAVDRSVARVALTAERARAEGLENVTAIHTDALTLPLGDATCDLVVLVGVLEWVGVESEDAFDAQRRVLHEVARVLRPNGQLLLGIENRWGAHYFAGAREEHTGLRFSSVLPRPVANAYSRVVRGMPVTTPTHSRRQLRRILDSAGLQARFAYPLPAYSGPQWMFDEDDAAGGRTFYLRHVFQYSSVARRLAAKVMSVVPAVVLRNFLPCFWVVASREVAPPVCAVVTGGQYAAGDVKAVDLRGRRFARYDRASGELRSEEALIDGWNARRWVSAPFSRRVRSRRLSWVVDQVTLAFVQRPGRAAADPEIDDAIAAAASALAEVSPSLPSATRDWCRSCLGDAAVAPLQVAVEHGDLLLTNLLIRESGIEQVDRGAVAETVAGVDAASLLFDVMSAALGSKGFRPEMAIDAASGIPKTVLESCRRLADAGLVVRGLSIDQAAAIALLRRSAESMLPELPRILDWLACAGLANALPGDHAVSLGADRALAAVAVAP